MKSLLSLKAVVVSFAMLLITFTLAVLAADTTIRSLIVREAPTKADAEVKQFLADQQAKPFMNGLGTIRVVQVLRVKRATVYEITYANLPGSDFFGNQCPTETYLLFRGCDGRYQSLNLQPFSKTCSHFRLQANSPTLKRFALFLKICGFEPTALSRRNLGLLFITLVCHGKISDFPVLLADSSGYSGGGQEQGAQVGAVKAFLAKAYAGKLSGAVAYREVVKYKEEAVYDSSGRPKYVEPIIGFTFLFGKGNKLLEISAQPLNLAQLGK